MAVPWWEQDCLLLAFPEQGLTQLLVERDFRSLGCGGQGLLFGLLILLLLLLGRRRCFGRVLDDGHRTLLDHLHSWLQGTRDGDCGGGGFLHDLKGMRL